MEWTGLNELREKFLEFFEEKGHLRLPSFSLIPDHDKSLLLINSGMAPMKKYFTGEITPPCKRVTTCQKCIRTPDIERVGITARHGTFFEMLGNFSFGDYFKREAIGWAWEFFTEVLKMPSDKLYISVYTDDDEAYDIWTKEICIPESHMKRLGKEDNFWEHGSGPCGPCSEIYFDRGEKYSCGKPSCGVGCDCDRYVEIWNIVFSQFDSDGKGNYPPMEHPNIDTGMGLERLACVMQGVENLFLVDTVQSIMKRASEISGVKYGLDEKNDISLRVITDHIRSATFMIGDGILPSNEGRGYVLRRLLRRAARHGRLLGINGAFLSEMADSVIKENEKAYPELAEKHETIKKVIAFEEESFAKAIDQGLNILNSLIEKADNSVLSGESAFLLNDTYGFPIDLTKEILAEKNMSVDEKRFSELMSEQKIRARTARRNAGADAWKGDSNAAEGLARTEFTGYGELESKAKILAVIEDAEKKESAAEGTDIVIVLDRTPFYAESGGQIGDSGRITVEGGEAQVEDTVKNADGVYLHMAHVTEGTIRSGAQVTAEVDSVRRHSIMRNHTAAHLLQAALRKVIGAHVEQAGQLVDGDKLRFDFTHFSALTPQELAQVEMLVNGEILKADKVNTVEMPIDEARKSGAMALFGEKYGDVVRVVSVGDFSKELCGGTHMDSTAKLGLFKIISESSVAAGVRRIEAVTGAGVLGLIKNYTQVISETERAMKVNSFSEMPQKANQLVSELKEKEREIERLNVKLAKTNVEGIFKNAQEVCGIKIVTMLISGTGSDALRALCDRVKDFEEPVVAVFAGISDEKANLAAAVNKAAMALGVKAGDTVKATAAVTGGNGGGRPDFAMAGAKDQTKLDEALAAVPEIVKKQVK